MKHSYESHALYNFYSDNPAQIAALGVVLIINSQLIKVLWSVTLLEQYKIPLIRILTRGHSNFH